MRTPVKIAHVEESVVGTVRDNMANRDDILTVGSHTSPIITQGQQTNCERDLQQPLGVLNNKGASAHCEPAVEIQNMIAALTEQFKLGLQSILKRQAANVASDNDTASGNVLENVQHRVANVATRRQSNEIVQPEEPIVSSVTSGARLVVNAEVHHARETPQTSSEGRWANAATVGYHSAPSVVHSYDNVRIIDLPKFSGDPTEWPLFERTFYDTTNEFGYNETRNIIRLRQALTADARASVESLLAFPQSVNDIMSTLKDNFGRPEQLMSKYVHCLRKYPKIQFGNIDVLVKFSNMLKNMAAFAKYTCAEYRLCDATLLGECICKLPYELQVQWAEYKENIEGYATVEDLSKFVSVVAQRANAVRDTMPKVFETKSAAIRGHPKGYTFAANVQVSKSKSCLICSDLCEKVANCARFKNMSADDRWQKVKELRLCFTCLKTGHPMMKCYSKQKCQVDGCDKRHHKLLHRNARFEAEKEVPAAAFSAEARLNSGAVYFQILPVRVSSGDKIVSTYAFIDHGASHSMIDKSLAEKLGISGESETLDMQWINNIRVTYPARKVSFSICGLMESCVWSKMSNVYAVKDMNLPKQSVNVNDKYKKNGRLVSLHYDNAKPEIIIGLDHVKLTVPIEVPLEINEAGAVAVRTKLGYVVYGPSGEGSQSAFVGCSFGKRGEQMEALMNDYFSDDNFGVLPVQRNDVPAKERDMIEEMEKNTTYENGRYVVRLLWKNEQVRFPASYNVAARRLNGIEQKMRRDKEFAEMYKSIIADYLAKGYIRKLTETESVIETNKTFYLPHFAVKNPNKKKLRVVFDAAAEIDGCSLNNQLFAGPDLTTPLLTVLFRFRHGKVAVCADIREMFLQVCVSSDDQSCQRFLWRDGDVNKKIDVYVMTRMLFGAKCSPCLAQFIKNKNARMYSHLFPRAVESVLEHHYVDDWADSFGSEQQAIEVIQQVVDIHLHAGFQLHNFSSNSNRVLKSACTEVSNEDLVNMQGQNIERVLGMHWNCTNDTFVFKLRFNKVHPDILNQTRRPTKRETLSVIMSIFDPFGFLADFVIIGKLLMQSLWANNVGWDEQLPDREWNRWKTWLNGLCKIERIREPRCLSVTPETEAELHIFCDASEAALSAVAYLRTVSEDGSISVRFVYAKTRCAPTKFTSIPRMELQAAVLAVRLKDTIVQCNQWQKYPVFMWCDSTTVISWINSDARRYKPYVGNRLAEILESTKADQWFWVPTEKNVADDATRASLNYEPNTRWIKGPEFLRNEDEWPELPKNLVSTNDEVELRKMKYVFVADGLQFKTNLLDYAKFSDFNRLRRSLAWLLRFVARCRNPIRTDECGSFLSSNEIEKAEVLLCILAQRECFSAEIDRIKSNQSVSGTLASLNPKLDEAGLLRVSGRIDRAECLTLEERRPIILPKEHPLTKLILIFYHQKFRHMNRNTVVCEIRRKYWVLCLRQLMKKVEAECNFCKVNKAKPYQPMMGLLPLDRVTPYQRPFSFTGVDLFGPLMVTIGRRKEKRWVAIFTCLTVRAVHLELVADLSTDACLLAIRNFINRRGVPKIIRSDNGTNFVGIAKELKNVNDFMDYGAIGESVSNLGIQWRFNCPANPSEGGAWERLIHSVKKTLNVVLRERAPKPETLLSVLIEAENIVNSRPLTHLPLTAEEEEPLTPNHFLLNGPNSTQTPAAYEPNICLRKQWRIAQSMKNNFWQRWVREYLPDLTRRTKWCHSKNDLKVGDLVLICDAAIPRSQWRRGKVNKLIFGADKVARSATVTTEQGLMRRPISKLAKLDVL